MSKNKDLLWSKQQREEIGVRNELRRYKTKTVMFLYYSRFAQFIKLYLFLRKLKIIQQCDFQDLVY